MTEFPLDLIKDRCEEFGIILDDVICKRLNTYGNMLLEWNEKINLTAITEPKEVVIKHFLDCILFFKAVNVPQNAKVIDVGTGAGFPGVVLKIIRPDIELTLLDGLNKRLIFLNEVMNELELRAEIIHLRAEEGGKNIKLREKFDIVCARAVARLNILSEYCIPFVKIGGICVAMKGPAANDELADGKRAISLLGGGETEIINEKLSENEERNFIITKKISQTPSKYPRISAKISKQPL